MTHRLDRVHDDSRGALGDRLRHDALDVGVGEDEQSVVTDLEPVGAQAHLVRGLLRGDIEDGARFTGERVSRLEQESGFPDPRLAAHEHDRSRDESAAEHPIEAGQTGLHSRAGRRGDVRKRPGA